MNRHRRSGSVEDVRTEQKRQRRRPALCRVRVINGRSLRGCPFILLSDTAPTGTIERSAARAGDCISAVAGTQLGGFDFCNLSWIRERPQLGCRPCLGSPYIRVPPTPGRAAVFPPGFGNPCRLNLKNPQYGNLNHNLSVALGHRGGHTPSARESDFQI